MATRPPHSESWRLVSAYTVLWQSLKTRILVGFLFPSFFPPSFPKAVRNRNDSPKDCILVKLKPTCCNSVFITFLRYLMTKQVMGLGWGRGSYGRFFCIRCYVYKIPSRHKGVNIGSVLLTTLNSLVTC